MSYINTQTGNAAAATGLYKVSDGTANLAVQINGANVLVIDNTQTANFSTTGALIVPVGSDAQRPSGVNGMIRYNTSNNVFEVFSNASWVSF